MPSICKYQKSLNLTYNNVNQTKLLHVKKMVLLSNKMAIRDMMNKQSYVYILFNKHNGTLYTGVTSDLIKRVYEHKNKLYLGFTSKYGVDKLGYYEVFDNIVNALTREKQIKSGSRKKKLELIEKLNPQWKDLYDEII
jgi:putative endonuclease